jgi:sporulation protein YlmC with PRC-barrel domain
MRENEMHESDGMTTAVRRTEETMRLSDKTLHGRTVVSADGKVIGSIAEMFVSTSDWRVESIRIDLNNDIADRIGANRTIFHRGSIELPVTLVQSVSDAVLLNADVEQLREARRSPVGAAPQPAT